MDAGRKTPAHLPPDPLNGSKVQHESGGQIEAPPPPQPTILEPPMARMLALSDRKAGKEKPMMEVLLPAGKNMLRRAQRAPIEARALVLGSLFVRSDPEISGAGNALLGMRAATDRKLASASKVVTPGASILDLVANDEGWKDIQWVLERADAAVRPKNGAGKKGDGRILLAELMSYVDNPLDGAALTSTRMHELRTAVAQSAGATTIATLLPWQQAVAHFAAGAKSQTITLDQLDAYLTDARSDAPSGKTRWLSNNSLAALISGLRFAEKQSQGDFLAPVPVAVPNPAGGAQNLQVLLDPYKRMTVDLSTRNPVIVSYVLDAADQQLTIPRGRKDSFHNDPVLKDKVATTKDYAKSGKDQGHCAPDDDFRYGALAEWASYTMANMMPQEPELNRNSWRMLEDMVRQKVAASGGRAVIHTGPAYTDDKGNLIPFDQLKKMGVHDNVAIPTHCWKSILFQDGSGKNLETWNLVMPNDPNLPTSGPPAQKVIADGHRSLDSLQKLIGFDLYAPLDAAVKKSLLGAPKATTVLPDGMHVSLLGAPQGQITAPAGPQFSLAKLFPDMVMQDHFPEHRAPH